MALLVIRKVSHVARDQVMRSQGHPSVQPRIHYLQTVHIIWATPRENPSSCVQLQKQARVEILNIAHNGIILSK